MSTRFLPREGPQVIPSPGRLFAYSALVAQMPFTSFLGGTPANCHIVIFEADSYLDAAEHLVVWAKSHDCHIVTLSQFVSVSARSVFLAAGC